MFRNGPILTYAIFTKTYVGISLQSSKQEGKSALEENATGISVIKDRLLNQGPMNTTGYSLSLILTIPPSPHGSFFLFFFFSSSFSFSSASSPFFHLLLLLLLFLPLLLLFLLLFLHLFLHILIYLYLLRGLLCLPLLYHPFPKLPLPLIFDFGFHFSSDCSED